MPPTDHRLKFKQDFAAHLAQMALPDWLVPIVIDPDAEPRLTKAMRELERTHFEMAFDYFIEQLSCGRMPSSALIDYHLELDYKRMLAWVRKDEARWKQYNEALQAGAEVIRSETMDEELAARRPIPEDPNAARVRFDKTKWHLTNVDRRRFGSATQVSGDPDAPLEIRVIHSIARSALDEYRPSTIDAPGLPAIEHQQAPDSDGDGD